MTEFMVTNSIGVSKESQVRGPKILQVVADTHEHNRGSIMSDESNAFFEHSYNLMAKRWNLLSNSEPRPQFPSRKCAFSGRTFATQPAFAWVKCEGEIHDCERFLLENKILTIAGKHFGETSKVCKDKRYTA